MLIRVLCGSKREIALGLLLTMSEDDNDFDRIEVLSSHIEIVDDIFVDPKPKVNQKVLDELEKKERERKKVARVVVVVSAILFMLSIVLVGVSLTMSKNIDEIVRNSNELLKKHSQTQLAAEGTPSVGKLNVTRQN